MIGDGVATFNTRDTVREETGNEIISPDGRLEKFKILLEVESCP
jgi:hypothetical protein